MSFSRIAFMVMYAADIILAYMLMNNYIAAIVAAVAITIIIFIWQKVTLFRIGAMHISKCGSADAVRLQSAYDEVEARAKACGYKFNRKPKLYVSDEDTCNAYNCGDAIVVNRPVLYGQELAAVLSHEVNHWRCGHSYLSMLLGLNIFAFGIALSLFTGLWLLLSIIFIVAIIGLISKNSSWFGLILAKLLIPLQKGVCNLIVTILLAIEMAISRKAEYNSDEFAAYCGYGDELILFLSTDKSLRKSLTFTERLLSTHPSDECRIAKIEHLQDRIQYKTDENPAKYYIE
ncbi:MAG: M48 family metalloprotease [Clostridiales bacterium]|nr:M48 family metalloprotease [Clostridiales bacterium]